MPDAYHIAHKVIYGNDVELVFQAAGEAVARLREGDGPYFLECTTYRWHKHFLSEALEDLRPKQEIEEWKKKCPVNAFERRLLKRKILSPAKIKSINKKILDKVEAAHLFALKSPYPRPEDALEDIHSV
jgi:TPP-dependent pyruvate/acetoin dehydrogenase alpha subunit